MKGLILAANFTKEFVRTGSHVIEVIDVLKLELWEPSDSFEKKCY